jgi:hypothetical protein
MTTQVIAFTKRLEFKTLLDIECKGLTGFAPVIKDSMEDFQSILNLFSGINVLIVDQPTDPKEFSLIMNLITKKEGEIKSMIFVGDQEIDLKSAKIFKLNNIDSFVDHLKKLLNQGEKQEVGYISIPADSLIHFKVLPFDLYIKISEGKYIKRIHADEDIDSDTVKSFQAKGIKELFFDRQYNRDFSRMLVNNLLNKVEGDFGSNDEKLKARSEVFTTTKELVQSVGLPAKVIQVCESVMDKISQDVNKEKDRFSTYLSHIKNQQDLSFQFRFVELTSFIATQIVEDMNQPDRMEQIKKVVFASFFCDIPLTDAEHLYCRSDESIQNFWHTDKKKVEEHALKAAALVSTYKNAPPGVEIIIREHHGALSGVGFSEISPSMQPLSKCLMASQELAMAILKDSDTSSKDLVKNIIQTFNNTPIYEYLVRFEKSCASNL